MIKNQMYRAIKTGALFIYIDPVTQQYLKSETNVNTFYFIDPKPPSTRIKENELLLYISKHKYNNQTNVFLLLRNNKIGIMPDMDTKLLRLVTK